MFSLFTQCRPRPECSPVSTILRSPRLFCLCTSLALSLACMLLAPIARAISPEFGLQPAEVEGGQMLLHSEGAEGFIPAIIQRSKVHFDISGMIATVTLEQHFTNNTENGSEGVYAFPLPDKAAVRHMEIIIGERRIIGKVRERAEAQQVYQQALQAGKKASLVEQQRPNLFTNHVANIGPGETITVKLEYVQPIEYRADTFSLRFPMTITPRYMPGVPVDKVSDREEDKPLTINPYLGWAVPTDQVPDAHAISPRQYPLPGSDESPHNPIEISATLDVGMPLARVESPYHDIALSRREGIYAISLARGSSEMNRDFELSWQPVTGAEPSAAFFVEEVEGEYFGLLMVVPPPAQRLAGPSGREITFVIDTSGSMGGVSIRQARASLSRALERLQPDDRFNIIEFNSSHQALYRNPVPATRQHVQRALAFVRQLDASGGTEMLPALRAALVAPEREDTPNDGATLRQVVFITDGAIGNETALYEEIKSRLGHYRLFTVAIGSAPNSWFMRKAAEYGRGSHVHISRLDEVEEKMASLFEHLAHPFALDMVVDWPLQVESWPERVPDLYAGQPVVQAVSFGRRPPTGKVIVSGTVGGRPWQQALALSMQTEAEKPAGHSGVATMWARARITGLLDQKVAGRDSEEVRRDVLAVALQHQLLSPYTSFVAVEQQLSRPAEGEMQSQPVLNTRPLGQSPQRFAYPATATSGPLSGLLAALALVLALVLWLLKWRSPTDA